MGSSLRSAQWLTLDERHYLDKFNYQKLRGYPNKRGFFQGNIISINVNFFSGAADFFFLGILGWRNILYLNSIKTNYNNEKKIIKTQLPHYNELLNKRPWPDSPTVFGNFRRYPILNSSYICKTRIRSFKTSSILDFSFLKSGKPWSYRQPWIIFGFNQNQSGNSLIRTKIRNVSSTRFFLIKKTMRLFSFQHTKNKQRVFSKGKHESLNNDNLKKKKINLTFHSLNTEQIFKRFKNSSITEPKYQTTTQIQKKIMATYRIKNNTPNFFLQGLASKPMALLANPLNKFWFEPNYTKQWVSEGKWPKLKTQIDSSSTNLTKTSHLTYSSEFYIPVQIIDQISKKMYLRWLLLADLPIQTKRGHFIINGYPKTVIHQIVRSPGIRFKNEGSGLGDNQILADIISMRGAWMGIQIVYEKNIKAANVGLKSQNKRINMFQSNFINRDKNWTRINQNKRSNGFKTIQPSRYPYQASFIQNTIIRSEKIDHLPFSGLSVLKAKHENKALEKLKYKALFISQVLPVVQNRFIEKTKRAKSWKQPFIKSESASLFKTVFKSPGGRRPVLSKNTDNYINYKDKLLPKLFKFPLNSIKESEKINEALSINFFISSSRTDKTDKKRIKLSGFAFLDYLFDHPYFVYNNSVPSFRDTTKEPVFPASMNLLNNTNDLRSPKRSKNIERRWPVTKENYPPYFTTNDTLLKNLTWRFLKKIKHKRFSKTGLIQNSSLNIYPFLTSIPVFHDLKQNDLETETELLTGRKRDKKTNRLLLTESINQDTSFKNAAARPLIIYEKTNAINNGKISMIQKKNVTTPVGVPPVRWKNKNHLTSIKYGLKSGKPLFLDHTLMITSNERLQEKFIQRFSYLNQNYKGSRSGVFKNNYNLRDPFLDDKLNQTSYLHTSDKQLETKESPGSIGGCFKNKPKKEHYDFFLANSKENSLIKSENIIASNRLLSSLVSILNRTNFRDILFERFMNPKFYDIGLMGRKRLNKKLRLNIPLQCTSLTALDFLAIFYKLFSLYNNFSLIQNSFPTEGIIPIKMPFLGDSFALNSKVNPSKYQTHNAYGSLTLRERIDIEGATLPLAAPTIGSVFKPKQNLLNTTFKQTGSLDHLNQRHIRTSGEFLFLQFWRAILRFYQVLSQLSNRSNFIKSSSTATGKTGRNFFSLSSISLFPSAKPLASAIRELNVDDNMDYILPISNNQTHVLKAYGYLNPLGAEASFNPQATAFNLYQYQCFQNTLAGEFVINSNSTNLFPNQITGSSLNNFRKETLNIVINRNDLNSILPYTPYFNSLSTYTQFQNTILKQNERDSISSGYSKRRVLLRGRKRDKIYDHQNFTIKSIVNNFALTPYLRKTSKKIYTLHSCHLTRQPIRLSNLKTPVSRIRSDWKHDEPFKLYEPKIIVSKTDPMIKHKESSFSLFRLKGLVSSTKSADILTIPSSVAALKNADRVNETIIKKLLYETKELRVFDAKERMRNLETKLFNGVFKEFFNLDPLSQDLDETNGLSEIIHKRRISALGKGGVTSKNAPLSIRSIHPSFYGRLCPIDSPEGDRVGLINSLTNYARINSIGYIATPFYRTRQHDYIESDMNQKFSRGGNERDINSLLAKKSRLQMRICPPIAFFGKIPFGVDSYNVSPSLRLSFQDMSFSLGKIKETMKCQIPRQNNSKQIILQMGPLRYKKTIFPMNRVQVAWRSCFNDKTRISLWGIRGNPFMNHFKSIRMNDFRKNLEPIPSFGTQPRWLASNNFMALPNTLKENNTSASYITKKDNYNRPRKLELFLFYDTHYMTPPITHRETIINNAKDKNMGHIYTPFLICYFDFISFQGYAPITAFQFFSPGVGLIPFLEHDDGTRALMGANMQRQAVPLISASRPIVGTGLEKNVAASFIISSSNSGYLYYISGKQSKQIFTRFKSSVNPYGVHKINPLSSKINRFPNGIPVKNCNLPLQKQRSSGRKVKAFLDKLPLKYIESKQTITINSIGTDYTFNMKTTYPWKNHINNTVKTFHNEKFENQNLPATASFFCKTKTHIKLFSKQSIINTTILSRESELKSRFTTFLKRAFTGPLAVSRILNCNDFKTRHHFILNTHWLPYRKSYKATIINKKPAISENSWLQKGDLLVDGTSSLNGELALGRNLFSIYMPWEGYNFEDAILISDKAAQSYTTIHVEEFSVKISKNEFVSSVVKPFTWVNLGDILVSKKRKLENEFIMNRLLFGMSSKPKLKNLDNSSVFDTISIYNFYGDLNFKKKRGGGRKVSEVNRSALANRFTRVLKPTNAAKATFRFKKRKGVNRFVFNNYQTRIFKIQTRSYFFTDAFTVSRKSTGAKNVNRSQNFWPFDKLKIDREKPIIKKSYLKNKDPKWFLPSFKNYCSLQNLSELDSPFSKIIISGETVTEQGYITHNEMQPVKRQVELDDSLLGMNEKDLKLLNSSSFMGGSLKKSDNFEIDTSYRTGESICGWVISVKSQSQVSPDVSLQAERRRDVSQREQLKINPSTIQKSVNPGIEKPRNSNHVINRELLKPLVGIYTGSIQKFLNLLWVFPNRDKFKATLFYKNHIKEFNFNSGSPPCGQKNKASKKIMLSLLLKTTFGISRLARGSLQKPNHIYLKWLINDSKIHILKSDTQNRLSLSDAKTPYTISRLKTKHTQLNALQVPVVSKGSAKQWGGTQSTQNSRQRFGGDTIYIYVAVAKPLQVGDKMSGRHGNKGIISKILPFYDMPYLIDGTPIDIVLNPLGVPSRMNVGQIYESLLGLTGFYKQEYYRIPPFDENYSSQFSRNFVYWKLHELNHLHFFKRSQAAFQNKTYDGINLMLLSSYKGLQAKPMPFLNKPWNLLRFYAMASTRLIRKRYPFNDLQTIVSKSLHNLETSKSIKTRLFNRLLFIIQDTTRGAVNNKRHPDFYKKIPIYDRLVRWCSRSSRINLAEEGYQLLNKCDKVNWNTSLLWCPKSKILAEVDPFSKSSNRFDTNDSISFIRSSYRPQPYRPLAFKKNWFFNLGSVQTKQWSSFKPPGRRRPLINNGTFYTKRHYSLLRNENRPMTEKFGLNPYFPGKMRLLNGLTGETFYRPIIVGKSYMLKLIHLVHHKIHARATGPYALITQQPLKGKRNQGGQRMGEMEIWALYGFGSASILYEMLTIKSDDPVGRERILREIAGLKGTSNWKTNEKSTALSLRELTKNEESRTVNDSLEKGISESFRVLVMNLRALCLDMQVFKDLQFRR